MYALRTYFLNCKGNEENCNQFRNSKEERLTQYIPVKILENLKNVIHEKTTCTEYGVFSIIIRNANNTSIFETNLPQGLGFTFSCNLLHLTSCYKARTNKLFGCSYAWLYIPSPQEATASVFSNFRNSSSYPISLWISACPISGLIFTLFFQYIFKLKSSFNRRIKIHIQAHPGSPLKEYLERAKKMNKHKTNIVAVLRTRTITLTFNIYSQSILTINIRSL